MRNTHFYILHSKHELTVGISFQKKATGQELMEKIHYQMDIIEKDYFGLQYTDHNHVSHWLDPTKLIKKQVKSKIIHNLNEKNVLNIVIF